MLDYKNTCAKQNSGFTTVRFVDHHYRRYNPESSAYFQIIWSMLRRTAQTKRE